MTMIAAGKFHNHVAPGKPPRQANGRHRRLSAGVHHAHHVHSGKRLDDQLCQAYLPFGRRPKGTAIGSGLLYGRHDLRMRVAEDERSPGAHVVDIDITIDIIDACSGSTLNEGRLQIYRLKGSHRTVYTARNELLRLLKKRC